MSVIDAIREVPRRHASAVFLVDAESGREITYAEAHDLACRSAARLREAGIRRGDRVCVLAENSAAVPIAYLALLYAGATFVPINPVLSDEDIRFVIDATRPRAVLASARQRARVPGAGARIELASIRGEPLLDGRPVADADLLAPLEGARDADELCITFTSGSTAFPKGVVHTIGSLFGNALAFDSHTGVGSDRRFMHLLPMSYMAGLLNLLACPFMAGASVIVGPEFSARSILDFWSVPMHAGANAYWLVPTIVAMLLRADRDGRAPDFLRSSAPMLFCGTAPLPPADKRAFAERYGVELRPSYGTSELLLITVNDPARGHRDDSVGTPIRGVTLRVAGRGDEGGEILVATPSRSPGYLGEEPAGSSGQWSATGDLGVLLPDGELIVTGRKKELIISGGVNVSPAAVERVVGEHPGVEACAAVGIPDPILGERVVVAVRLREDHDPTAVRAAIVALARERLAPAQRPAEVVVLDSLPFTPTGKVRRGAVREDLLRRRPP